LTSVCTIDSPSPPEISAGASKFARVQGPAKALGHYSPPCEVSEPQDVVSLPVPSFLPPSGLRTSNMRRTQSFSLHLRVVGWMEPGCKSVSTLPVDAVQTCPFQSKFSPARFRALRPVSDPACTYCQGVWVLMYWASPRCFGFRNSTLTVFFHVVQRNEIIFAFPPMRFKILFPSRRASCLSTSVFITA